MAEDLTRVVFHQGDVVLKLLKLKGLRQNELARRAGHRPNTITKLINGHGATEAHVLADVLRVLEVERDQVDALVLRMNGGEVESARLPVLRATRLHNERGEDRDPDRHEAALLVRKVLHLPDVARLALYTMIRAIESIHRGDPPVST